MNCSACKCPAVLPVCCFSCARAGAHARLSLIASGLLIFDLLRCAICLAGVSKCVSHRVPIRREESSVRLVPELGHDALPMDEPNAVTMGLAYPMLHNCIPLYCTLILRSGHDMIE